MLSRLNCGTTGTVGDRCPGEWTARRRRLPLARGSVAVPVPIGREDKGSRPDQACALPEGSWHDGDLTGEVQPRVRAQRLLERVKQQRASLRQATADRHDLQIAQTGRGGDGDAERAAGPAD